jgi:hypothetical protein
MPTISMFYGILIALFFRDDAQHKVPHIHARYQGFKASQVSCRHGNCEWSKSGSISIKTNYSPIGN